MGEERDIRSKADVARRAAAAGRRRSVPAPPKQVAPRDKPVQGWSRSTFGQAGRGRSGK